MNQEIIKLKFQNNQKPHGKGIKAGTETNGTKLRS